MTLDPEVPRQMAAHVDAERWELADLLVELFPVRDYSPDDNTHTGLDYELRELGDALIGSHDFGDHITRQLLKPTYLKRYRATALAWPPGSRVPGVAFDAHQQLKGRNRVDEMAMFIAMNGGVPLSGRRLRHFRQQVQVPRRQKQEVEA